MIPAGAGPRAALRGRSGVGAQRPRPVPKPLLTEARLSSTRRADDQRRPGRLQLMGLQLCSDCVLRRGCRGLSARPLSNGRMTRCSVERWPTPAPAAAPSTSVTAGRTVLGRVHSHAPGAGGASAVDGGARRRCLPRPRTGVLGCASHGLVRRSRSHPRQEIDGGLARATTVVARARTLAVIRGPASAGVETLSTTPPARDALSRTSAVCTA
jgi:hypothetical protein